MKVLERVFSSLGLLTMSAHKSDLASVADKSYKAGARDSTRRYAGGVSNRLNADWKPSDSTADQDVYEAIVSIRAKARDLCQNNEIGKKFLRMCQKNIPGPYGFKLNMKVRKPDGTLDTETNTLIKEAWADFARREHCTVTGQLSMRQVGYLVTNHLVRDGEILARRVDDRRARYGFRLQILEPDLLDHRFNQRLTNGNVIIMGVELDRWRRPVAYHLRKYEAGLMLFGIPYHGVERERVPAAEIWHYYSAERAFQTRGITWLAATMLRMRMLSGWEEAALFNARIAASKMGFIHDKPSTESPDYTGNAKDGQGNFISEFAPGQIEDIGTKEFTQFDPKYPEAAHEGFVKSMGREIASGLDVSYPSLFSDLTEVSFSSIRQGTLDERETWMMIQEDLIEAFMEPCFTVFLEMAILSGRLPLKWITRFEEINKPLFIGKRWDWVDPDSDVTAKLKMLRSSMTSLTQITAERGDDLEEIFRERNEEEQLAKGYGIKLNFDDGAPKPSAASTEAPGSGGAPATGTIGAPKNGKSLVHA